MTNIMDQVLAELHRTLTGAIRSLDECRAGRPNDQQALAAHAAHVAAARRSIDVVQGVLSANFTDRVRAKANDLAASRLPDMLQTAKDELDAMIDRSPADYRRIGMAYMRVRSIKLASDLASATNS